jgi:type III restriction enzyme
MVDQVDLVSHDSYRQLLAQKDVLRQRLQTTPKADEVDEQGAATTAGDLDVPDPTVPTEQAATPEQAVRPSEPAGPAGGLKPLTWTTEGAEGDADALFFIESDDRQKEAAPKPQSRVEGAPQVTFPRREPRLTFAAFTLSDIPDGDAQAGGARFITEVPTFLAKDALEAERDLAGDVAMFVAPQKNVEAQQALSGIDTIREDLASAVLRQVTETKTERAAARRRTKAFLKGAGVTDATAIAQWGEIRRQQAIQGISELIRAAYAKRKREMTYELVPVTRPVEPVLVDGAAKNAYNDTFVKGLQFVGWQKNVMPEARFDAGSTEWAIAHLLDRDPDIQWWLRIYVGGPAFIPTTNGNYFPDFIAIDTDGVYWVVEGKSDKNATDADVIQKRDAAENWARAVRDAEDYGDWHYVFATETSIKQAGSWVNAT